MECRISVKAFCIYVSFRLNDTPDGLEVAVEDGAAVIYPFGTLGAEMERLPSVAVSPVYAFGIRKNVIYNKKVFAVPRRLKYVHSARDSSGGIGPIPILSLLNFADVARHHVLQDACSPARHCPARHARITSLCRKPEHETHSLDRPKRDLHAADGWRGLMKRGAWRPTAAREAQRGFDQYERDVNLKALRNGNVQDFAQEEITMWLPV